MLVYKMVFPAISILMISWILKFQLLFSLGLYLSRSAKKVGLYGRHQWENIKTINWPWVAFSEQGFKAFHPRLITDSAQVYPELLKRLDDSNDKIRVAVCEASLWWSPYCCSWSWKPLGNIDNGLTGLIQSLTTITNNGSITNNNNDGSHAKNETSGSGRL